MDDWKLPWDGGCRCGEVRLRVSKPPLLSGACHCTGCRRMSASAFSLTLTLPGDALEVTAGEPAIGGTHQAPPHLHDAAWRARGLGRGGGAGESCADVRG